MDINTTEPRFIIPKDSLGYERLVETQAIVKELKTENPEIISLCVFGSNVKGTAADKSDIDGWLFVDSSIVALQTNKEEKDVLEIGTIGEDFYAREDIHFEKDIEQKYNDLLRSKLKDRLNLADDQVKHVRTRPISESIMDRYITKWDSWGKEMKTYKARRIQQEAEIANHDFSGIFPHLPENLESGYISYIFHMALGHGIEKYRKYVINKLVDRGETGELIWKEIISGTEIMENHLSTNSKVSYPRNLAEAISIYGS